MVEGPLDNDAPRSAVRGGLLGDLFRLYFRPAALFAGLPVVNRAAAALWLLLALYALQAALVVASALVHAAHVDRHALLVVGLIRAAWMCAFEKFSHRNHSLGLTA